MNQKDYIFCKDCEEYVDFYKYDHDIKDAGHEDCNWRYVNKTELRNCIKDCKEDGCSAEMG